MIEENQQQKRFVNLLLILRNSKVKLMLKFFKKFSFVRESLQSFNKLNLEYLQKFERIQNNVHKKINDIQNCNKQNEAKEVKKYYNPVIQFFFQQFYQRILSFKKLFVNKSKFMDEQIIKQMEFFETKRIKECDLKIEKLNMMVSQFKITESHYLRKRNDYFDTIENVKLSKILDIKNFKIVDVKEKYKIFDKEWDYIRKINSCNVFIKAIKDQTISILDFYEQIIKEKFRILLDNFMQPLENYKLDQYMNQYKMQFVEFKMSTYIFNIKSFKENFFKFQSIVKYKNKLTQVEMQKTIDQIQLLSSQIKENFFQNQINFFSNIFIFDMKTLQQVDCQKKTLLTFRLHKNFHLLLLNLKLFLDYENSFLYLRKETFHLLKEIIIEYLYLNEDDIPKEPQILLLILQVSSKIFQSCVFDQSQNKTSILKNCMLHNLKKTSLGTNTLIWRQIKTYLSSQLQTKHTSSIDKDNEATEILQFYQYLIYLNTKKTIKIAKDLDTNGVLSDFSLQEDLKQKLIIHLSKIREKCQDEQNNSKIKKSYFEFFKIFCERGIKYLQNDNVTQIFVLSKPLYKVIVQQVIKQRLKLKNLTRAKRIFLWIKLSLLNKINNNKKKQILDQETIKQIEKDIPRTLSYLGKEFQDRLYQLIKTYLQNQRQNLQYFQGFSNIAGFLLDYIQNDQQTILILDYSKERILKDFFDENFDRRLKIIHFLINELVDFHFPNLGNHWKINQITSEFLFSGFLISLFTQIECKTSDFVFQFWDTILIDGWIGVIKIIMYLIYTNMEEFLKMSKEETMMFMFQMRSEEFFIQMQKQVHIKDFCSNFLLQDNKISLIHNQWDFLANFEFQLHIF